MITRSAGRAMTSPWQQECDIYEEEATVSEFLTQRTISTPNSLCSFTDGIEDQNIFAQLEKEPHRNFTQVCPPESYKKVDKCQLCKSTFNQILNSAKNCQFCGKSVCKDCSRRTRKDPQNIDILVRTCELCHQQMLYKRIVEAFTSQKNVKDKRRNELNEQCEKQKEEFFKKQKVNEEIKLQCQTQKLKQDQQIEEKRIQLQEQKDLQCKRLMESATWKDKIIKLQEERVVQEKELAQLRSRVFELNEHKKVLDGELKRKDAEFEKLNERYENIQNDIDKRKLRTQTQEIAEILDGKPKSNSAIRYQASIIDFNHLNSSLNKSQLESRLQKNNRKDEKQETGWCTKNDKSCIIF